MNENAFDNIKFESDKPLSKEEKDRNEMIKALQWISDNWPDQLALYSGMFNQTIAEGWEELAARSIVLNAILGGQAAFIIANIKNTEDSTE